MKINVKAGIALPSRVTAAARRSPPAAVAAPSNNTDSGGGGGGGNSGYTFAMITHETPGDTFWDRIKAGAQQAAKDTGSTLKYSSDPEATKQAMLIQNAIDSKVDGIATTLVTPDALIPTVKKADRGRYPGRQLQLRASTSTSRPARSRTSPPTRSLAGQEAGKKAQADGATKILCTIQQTGSVALEDRCAGVKDSFPNTENIQVNGADDAAVTSAIQAKLTAGQDHQLDHHPGRRAGAWTPSRPIEGAGPRPRSARSTPTPTRRRPSQDGKIQFFIDQQPYLQGYLAITQLYLYKKNGNILGGGKAVLTGPSFVDKTNVAPILPFVKQNTR